MDIKKKSQNKPGFVERIKKNYLILLVFGSLFAFLFGGFSYKNGFHVAFEGLWKTSMPPFFNEAVNNLVEEVSLYKSNNLETLYIDIPFESLHTLEKKRKEALELGILFSSDEDYVPAKISLNNDDSVEVDVRLKGDWTDHLEGDKWSLRVHVKSDEQIDGMTHFSLQAPETRLFFNEWVFHMNMAQENILTTRYNFVNVLINGEFNGVYAIEESFSEVLIESQKHRQGVIVNFDEDMMWRNTATFWEKSFYKTGDSLVTNIWTADISGFRGAHVAADPALSAEAEMAKNMLYSFQRGQLSASEIFDVELMGKYFALCDFWHAAHSTTWHNMRFYYNPISGLLEPIGFDGDVFWHVSEFPVTSEIILNPIFDDLKIRKVYAAAIKTYTSDEYINNLQESLSPQIELFGNTLDWEYRDFQANEGSGLEVPWDVLRSGAEMLRHSISPEKNISGTYKLFTSEQNKDIVFLELVLKNYMVIPVNLIALQINGHILTFGTDLFFPENQSFTILPEDLNQSNIENLLKFEIPDFLLSSLTESNSAEFDIQVIVTMDGVEKITIPLET